MRVGLMLIILLTVSTEATRAEDPSGVSTNSPMPALSYGGSFGWVGSAARRFSFAFYGATGRQSFANVEETAEGIYSIRASFDEFADAFEDATGINIRWSDEGFSDRKRAYKAGWDLRYHMVPFAYTPGAAGDEFRMDLELGMWNLRCSGPFTGPGTETELSEPGFGAAVREKVRAFDCTVLWYFPRRWSDVGIPLIGSRRDLYAGVGVDFAHGEHEIEIYAPDSGLQGAGSTLELEANQNTAGYHFVIGGEQYFSPWFSVNLELGWSSLVMDQLEWTDGSLETLKTREDEGWLYVEGWDSTDGVATAWEDWTPTAPVEGSWVGGYWSADPERPIEIDLSGFEFKAGLRVHFN